MTTRNEAFPKEVQLAAQHSQRETGVPACVTLAQWALESAYGKFTIGKFNCFGIKWRPTCPYPFLVRTTHEEVHGKMITTSARFIDFPTMESAFAWHGTLITGLRGPYKKAAAQLQKRPKDWKLFISLMAPVYATDKAYEKKLLKIIERYRLWELNLAA